MSKTTMDQCKAIRLSCRAVLAQLIDQMNHKKSSISGGLALYAAQYKYFRNQCDSFVTELKRDITRQVLEECPDVLDVPFDEHCQYRLKLIFSHRYPNISPDGIDDLVEIVLSTLGIVSPAEQ